MSGIDNGLAVVGISALAVLYATTLRWLANAHKVSDYLQDGIPLP